MLELRALRVQAEEGRKNMGEEKKLRTAAKRITLIWESFPLFGFYILSEMETFYGNNEEVTFCH